MELATHPGDHSNADDADCSVPLNFSRRLVRNHVCSSFSDLLAWPQLPVTLPQIIITHHLKENYFPYCVLGEGEVSVGCLAPTLCNITLTHCTPKKESMCEKCMNDPICRKAPVKFSICETNLTSTQVRYRATCSQVAPTSLGTRVLSDYYWLCGRKAYLSLPEGWKGVCAIVYLSDHTFYMKKVEHLHNHPRKRRTIEMEQTGFNVLGLTASTGVPWEYRIWGAGQKVGHGLFPWKGVGEIRDHVEINRYALLRLINATIDTAKGTKAELNAL